MIFSGYVDKWMFLHPLIIQKKLNKLSIKSAYLTVILFWQINNQYHPECAKLKSIFHHNWHNIRMFNFITLPTEKLRKRKTRKQDDKRAMFAKDMMFFSSFFLILFLLGIPTKLPPPTGFPNVATEKRHDVAQEVT